MSTISPKQIGLPPGLARHVTAQAKRVGKSPMEYVRWLGEKHVEVERIFAEILKPVRDGFKKSGVKRGQLDAIVDEARTAHAQQIRRARR